MHPHIHTLMHLLDAAIKASIQLSTGIICKNCYAYMGAGILIIIQYGYGGSQFDFEVKAGGGVGLSANVAMQDPSIRSMNQISLLSPSNLFSTVPLGKAVQLRYKFGGLTADLSGSGSATGSLTIGESQSAYVSQGLLYSASSGSRSINTYSSTKAVPYSTTSTLKTSSLSVTVALTAVENFEISYLTFISISFNATLTGTVSYSIGFSGYASVAVHRNDTKKELPARKLENEQESSMEIPYLNFLPGDVTVILFEYSGFNPSEEIILFYYVQRSDTEYPIMQKNFTTSESGSGFFEGFWSMPWDYTLAGVGTKNIMISVRASNSISKKFISESFGISIFTDSDGIFSAPSPSEAIPIGSPYTLRWTADLLHYFQPTRFGGYLGYDIIATEVHFEVIAEKIFLNGTVKSSTFYRNLTQGPVPNTGEYIVTFPLVLLDMGDRFYINVRSTNNSDIYGWSKNYFTLMDKQEPRSLLVPKMIPDMASVKPFPPLSSLRGLLAATSVPGSRSGVSRGLVTKCSPGEGSITTKLDGGLAINSLNIFFIKVDMSDLEPMQFKIIPMTTECIAGSTARPSFKPTAATPPPAPLRPTSDPTSSPPPSLTPTRLSPAPTSNPTPSAPPSLTPTRLTPAPTSNPTSTLVPVNQRATLNHRYSFSKGVTDSIGGAHGTTIGWNVKILNTRGYGRAVFNGDSGSAIQLPAHILEPTAGSGATAFSIELWATTSSTDTYSGYCPRLFQFGTTGSNADSVGISRAPCWPGVGYINAFSPDATDCLKYSEVLFNGAFNLHLVLTYALGGSMNLYLDGELTMSCSAKISQSSYSKAISTETNYLGRSLWSGDVGLSGSIDEFRVWNGELSAKSVVANFNAGPNYIILQTDSPTFSPVRKPS